MDIITGRYLLAHVLAAAVKRVIPKAKLGDSLATDHGFYYDFLLPTGKTFSGETLEVIAEETRSIMTENIAFAVQHMTIDEARHIFQGRNEDFKVQLVNDSERSGESMVLMCSIGEFVDICHNLGVAHLSDLSSLSFTLDRVTGAYWKGNEKNLMMQRIHALAFSIEAELKAFLKDRDEVMKRDHRKIGADLELFMISNEVGKGLPMLLPKGATMRRILERFTVDEELARGYEHVYTPALGRKLLYEISGHWEHYQDSMYPLMEIGGDEFVLRPMTCPHHFMMYKFKPRSYRDLPLRLAEISPQYRKEQSGELSGLFRVMNFNLADAHIFCTPDQLGEEFRAAVDLADYMMHRLGIDSAVTYRASLRDESKDKYVDNPEMWQLGERLLIEILDNIGLGCSTALGEAAFYGPKLDIQMRNVLGKEDTLITIQIDFCLPERFGLNYVDRDGQLKHPVVIHRSSIGAIERTMAFLIEYYAGAFPCWLAPVQVRLLTITDVQIPYAREIQNKMRLAKIRVELDDRNETLNKKIREARLQRVPYIVIIGPKEAEQAILTVRNRDTGTQTALSVDSFIANIIAEARAYSLSLTADQEEGARLNGNASEIPEKQRGSSKRAC